MHELFNIVTFWIFVIGGVWAIFSKISEVANRDLNAKVANWIQNVNLPERNFDVKEIIYEMFLGYFGVKHFSWKCFLRCFLYSSVIFLIIGILSGVFNEDPFKRRNLPVGFEPYFSPLFYIWLTMVFQDYISLYVTRRILRKILRTSIYKVRTIVFISFSFTFFISIVFSTFFLVMYRASGMLVYAPLGFSAIYGLMWPFRNPGMFYSMIYLGTFYIILVQSAGSLTRWFLKVFRFFNMFRGALDVQEKPIKSLGAILILCITIMYVIILPIILIS